MGTLCVTPVPNTVLGTCSMLENTAEPMKWEAGEGPGGHWRKGETLRTRVR